MLLTAFLFLLGLVLLVGGGESLVRGAAAIAHSVGVPPLSVGLVVVGFGTSAPEFFIAVTGAASGAAEVSFGNVVGAVIVNIALILGATALFRPLSVNAIVVTREIPMASLAIVATVILSFDALLGGGIDRLTRGDGLILLLLFCLFLYYTVRGLRNAPRDEFVRAAQKVGWRLRARSLASPAGFICLGLFGLIVGGNLLVDSAVKIAGAAGMTPAAIGLTIVAIGTTMPELTTALLAVRRGESDLAVGGIVGSNIFNTLAVLGTAAVISPIEVSARGQIALLIATGLTLLLIVFSATQKKTLIRPEGLFLIGVFAAYMAWVFAYR